MDVTAQFFGRFLLKEAILCIIFMHNLHLHKLLLCIELGEHDRERLSKEKEQVASEDPRMVMMMSPFCVGLRI